MMKKLILTIAIKQVFKNILLNIIFKKMSYIFYHIISISISTCTAKFIVMTFNNNMKNRMLYLRFEG